jgi:hypothetical protein
MEGLGSKRASAATDADVSQSAHRTLARLMTSARQPPRRARGSTPTNTSVREANDSTASTTSRSLETATNR